MATVPDVGAAVVGSGIAGLAAGLELQRETAEVLVVDAGDRPGGAMRTDHVAGYVVERGPNTFQVKAPLLAALREQRLDDALLKAGPASRRRFILRDRGLVSVPGSPLGLIGSPLLSAGGKLRLLAEPFVRRRNDEESVAEWGRRRLGAQAVAHLIGPFLTGIYAGDEEQLGAEAVFPQLVALERRFGSVAIGGLLGAFGRRGARGLKGSWSAPQGLGPLARRLAERLSERPALSATVTGLRREGSAWHLSVVSSAGQTEVRAAKVVLAVPADAAAQLLAPVEPRAAELLSGVAYAPVVSLPLGVKRADLARAARGFGFLVPRDGDPHLLGCLFMSQLFPGRAPRDHELLHCMLGGTRWPAAVDQPDDVLLAAAAPAIDRALGLRGGLQDLGAARWLRAIPQPGRDHGRRLAEVRARLSALPGLALAGSYVAGVSLADAFASGLTAAREVRGAV
jgi:oxygen-dependent protoporphyrinogen oxidase